MKKSFLIVLLNTIFFAFGVNAQSLPYTAEYSSNFKIGSHDLSTMVLTLYKDYEKNDLATHAGWFADTVAIQLPDGQVIQGKDAVLNAFKSERANGEVTFNMDAIIPLNSVDRKESWVALWGYTTSSQGRQDFQAVWRVNKDKKVDFMRIFTAQAPR